MGDLHLVHTELSLFVLDLIGTRLGLGLGGFGTKGLGTGLDNNTVPTPPYVAEDEQNIESVEGVTKEEVLAVDRTVSRSRERGAAATRSANNVSTALWETMRTRPRLGLS